MAAPSLTDALAHICSTLAEIDRAYALVGGLAVSARVEPRLTRDVDLAIDVADDPDAESLVRELAARGYEVTATVEQTGTGRLATVRLASSAKRGLVVDLLFASCGIEPEVVAAAERLEILPGLVVPVATATHLVAMKLLARDDRERPQDLDDLRQLLPLLGARERRDVARALATITERGFARGRDLGAAWREVSKTHATSSRR